MVCRAASALGVVFRTLSSSPKLVYTSVFVAEIDDLARFATLELSNLYWSILSSLNSILFV